jgi:hypothetical protein
MSRRRLTLKDLGYRGPTPIPGADIEVIERSSHDGPPHVLLPNALRINGEDVAVPEGARVQVHDISDSELVTVTLTVFARSLSVRHETTAE